MMQNPHYKGILLYMQIYGPGLRPTVSVGCEKFGNPTLWKYLICIYKFIVQTFYIF